MKHLWAGLTDSYSHARDKCGSGRVEAVYRAIFYEITGRWPW